MNPVRLMGGFWISDTNDKRSGRYFLKDHLKGGLMG